LRSLATSDRRANDLDDCFDFAQAPRAFKKIFGQRDAAYFARQLPSAKAPDDD
jgi:hypothetical protein